MLNNCITTVTITYTAKYNPIDLNDSKCSYVYEPSTSL